MKKASALAVCMMSSALATAAFAQPRAIDTTKSTLTIHVSKSGVLSALSHNHEIAAPIAGGTVDATARTVELHVSAKALEVRDSGVSDKDRSEIQRTMSGPEVLDAANYPDITFRSTSAESAGTGSWKVQGELTLHGQHHPVTVEVREVSGRFEGGCGLKQTEFGIKPVKAGGGTVRVKDEIRIEFQIQLAH
jgi:polyisoprenoid-binding protein YceI